MAIKSLTILLLTFAGSAAAEVNEKCPFPNEYIEIDRAYHQCTQGQVRRGESCNKFVSRIERLFPAYDCKRSFDTSPVPAIWLFDAASEAYIKLLYELASDTNPTFSNQWFVKEKAEAKRIFLSPGFKSVLDGYIAEEYFPLIEQVRRNAP